MEHTYISALLLSAALGAGCGGSDAQFDAQAFAGAWRGRWVDDAGGRGGVDLTVADEGDALGLACDILRPNLPGLYPDTERVDAAILGDRAVISDHDSKVFGQVSGTIDADGRVAIDCEDVFGPVHSLHALGTWSADTLNVEVDVTYDGSLRTSRAYVELQRRRRD